jgi:hypothetical protein
MKTLFANSLTRSSIVLEHICTPLNAVIALVTSRKV